MTTELDINKYLSATVHGDSVIIRDTQNGEIALSDSVFERLFLEYLKESNTAGFVQEVED